MALETASVSGERWPNIDTSSDPAVQSGIFSSIVHAEELMMVADNNRGK